MDWSNPAAVLLSTAASFLFLAVMFWPLEIAFPARPGQKFFRPDWWNDLCFFLGQYFLWSGLVLWALTYVNGWVYDYVPGSFRAAVGSQPFWLQAIEVVLISDFLIYWAHRWQHSNSFLWRFHSVHHTAEHLDWLAAHREHPLDSIYTIGLINLPAVIMGFSLDAIAALVVFRGIWAIYIHSNVRLPLGPLRMLIGAPELHHWHHAKDRRAGNYANVSPLMDILFGTYTCPDHEPEEFGIEEPSANTYIGHMIEPLLPARKHASTEQSFDS